MDAPRRSFGIAGILAEKFVDSKITLLVIIAVTAMGLFALFVTPREENPQISVPAANVIVGFPGATPEEVEKLVVRPLEAKLWEITGVEHIYSMALDSMAVVTVQFYVGQPEEESLFKVYSKLMSNMDLVPKGVMEPLVKPIDVDDVPIITVALSSAERSDRELRRVADRVIDNLRSVFGTSLSTIQGGRKRQINIEVDPLKLQSYNLSILALVQRLQAANVELPAGDVEFGGRRIMLRGGDFLRSADDVARLVVSAREGRPVYLRDVATVEDGMEVLESYSRIYEREQGSTEVNMVTVAVAKRAGANAVNIAEEIRQRVHAIQGSIIPSDVRATITRNDGKRADDTVNELVGHLVSAIISVLVVILLTMTWRESLIVSLAIPLTLFLTLTAGFLTGQTINRITLFALILSIGILVDDAIIVVENIARHFQLRTGKGDRRYATLFAVDEIGSPTIVATFLIIIVFIPMAFVTGMMGPYMAPIPFNVPLTMFFSMAVAFVVTPWAAYRFLGAGHGADGEAFDLKKTFTWRIYHALMGPLVRRRTLRRLFLGGIALLFFLVLTLPLFLVVQFRMLPKADKETFKISIDMPVGTTLERTDAVARSIGLELQKLPELKNYQTFVGIPDVVDFNGLLRGGTMKKGKQIAEIRVNIVSKHEREETSEQVALRIRPAMEEIGRRFGAKVKIVEDPPGPPTRSTILTELYGEDYDQLRQLAIQVREHFKQVDGIVDVDDSVTEDVVERLMVVDDEKATLSGVTTEQVSHTLAMAFPGAVITTIHDVAEREQVGVFIRLKEEYRRSAADLDKLFVLNPQGQRIPLTVLVRQEERKLAKPIHHKDLRRVAYAYGEMARRGPVYAVFDLMAYFRDNPLPAGVEVNQDGEWRMTVDVFRDLGLAMAVGVFFVFLILVGWFKSFTIPMILMGSIPLTIIGVFPGHGIFEPLFGFTVFFSATGMIGVIALSGIVVRNSIILIDFILEGMRAGRDLFETIIEAGAVRFRPIFLTAVTNVLGVMSIALDPMWESLAWSIIFGMVASTTLTLFVIPALYVEFVGERHPDTIP